MNKKNVLISACLLGVNCRYDGKSVPMEQPELLMEKVHLIPICPEILGGLSIPRKPAERVENRVINNAGEDVTEYFNQGTEEVLRLARLYGCKSAILKERSPSCGYGKIYDGTFSHTVIDGSGIMAEGLEQEGIRVYGENDMERFFRDYSEAESTET